MKIPAAFLLFCSLQAGAQVSPENVLALKKKEDSLKVHAVKMLQGINAADRFKADSMFTRMFVRALKIPNSFYYPFDSVATISKLYPADSSFRIYTWQMVINDNIIRQHGAIQMKTGDGSLQLFPLIDRSDFSKHYEDTIADNLGWMGAVYYKIITKEYNGRKFYTLLGFDQNNIRSDKKVVEVLSFENGKPRFGGPFFAVPNNSLIASNPARYVMEFKKSAGPRLNWDEDLQMIVMEHMVSETNEPAKKWTYIGDGDYEGLQWKGGRWIYVGKIFDRVTPEGKPPVPEPIRDEKGKIDDTKLKGSKPDEK